MLKLNCLPPSIEPQASGHIIEQQQMVDTILKKGFAYESNGSVYFDVEEYNKQNNYGKLSGRNIADLLSTTRELEGQEEKKNSFDFALWKKASPEHIMRWPSKWSDGFPGWHLECSVMSTKYLGEEFDIHGGGMDLLFPHHECEIAQTKIANGKESVKYWMHNNMITVNGQKMGKSLGNSISLDEFFTGNHPLLEKAYAPMTIRFFILQAHYRSTVDFSNEALQAAEKGLQRLWNAMDTLAKLKPQEESSVNIAELEVKCYQAINDDLNSPVLIANLFDGVRIINSIADGKENISKNDLVKLKNIYTVFVVDILGFVREIEQKEDNSAYHKAIDLLLNLRMQAKANKDFETSDKIRNELQTLGFIIKDKKDGFEWELND
jgi:cysteinyl-tRNA synthetase